MANGKEVLFIPAPNFKKFPIQAELPTMNMAVWHAEFPQDEDYGSALYEMLKVLGCGVTQEDGRPRSPEGIPSSSRNMHVDISKMFHTSDLVHVILSERALHEYGNGKYLEGLTSLHDINMQRGLDEHLVVLIRLEDTFAKMFQGISYLDLYPGANEQDFSFGLAQAWSNAAGQQRYR